MITRTFVASLALLAGAIAAAGAAEPAAAPAAAIAPGAMTLSPLGDSRTAAMHYDAAHLNMTTQSHINWANALNQQKYPCTGNFGISGAVSDTIIAQQLAPALATHARYMPILMGVNDVKNPGFSAEHTMSNIISAATQAMAQGTTPILFTDPGAEHYVPAQVAFINELNAKIKAYAAANPKVVLFDMAGLVCKQQTPAIVFQPGWSYDGVHLQTVGAYKVGIAFAELLDSLGAKAPPNPALAGNLLKNLELAGSTGKLGNGNTGALPDDFAGSSDNANCSATFSVGAGPGGGKEIVASFRATAQNKLGGIRIAQSIPAASLRAGESLQAGVEAEIEPGSVNLDDVRAEVVLVFKDQSFAAANNFMGTIAREGKPRRDTISSIPGSPRLLLTLQSPINQFPAGKELSSIQFRLGARIAGEGNATIHFRHPWCKKVTQ